jgi:hypothetical protein
MQIRLRCKFRMKVGREKLPRGIFVRDYFAGNRFGRLPRFGFHGCRRRSAAFRARSGFPDGVAAGIRSANGIRMTGMYPQGDSYSDSQLWSLAAFIRRARDLPPAVAQAIRPPPSK